MEVFVTWQERMNAALGAIEAGLDGNLDWDTVAATANCSLYHFFRVFEVVAGMSAGDYLRRRRLSKAALDLAAGGFRVIDVALRYGYETPESFSKAFKRTFGVKPSELGPGGPALALFTPMKVSLVLKGAQEMKYRIEEREAIDVIGPTLRTGSDGGRNLREIPAYWQECMQNGSFGKLVAACGPMGILGICLPAADARTGEFDYMIGVEAGAVPGTESGAGSVPDSGQERSKSERLPAEWKRARIPASTYGVFESLGPMPLSIQEVWKRVFSEWFPASGYEHAGTPDFEVYPPFMPGDPRGDGDSPECYAEVWVPLRKSAG